jgi:hypothetical protein
MSDFIEEGDAASDALRRISQLAQLMVEQQRFVETLDAQLRDAKEALRRTETEDLPELMSELGLTQIKLADGSKVEVRQDLHCGISEARRAEAHRWLEARGFGGLIKTALSVDFGREERQAAIDAARTVAGALHRDVSIEDAVHPATLKAFLKEQLALGPDGSNPPADLFGIQPYNKAKLTAPKAKAPRKQA